MYESFGRYFQLHLIFIIQFDCETGAWPVRSLVVAGLLEHGQQRILLQRALCGVGRDL